MQLVLNFCIILMTFFFPFIMLPVNFSLFFLTKGRNKMYYILFAFCIALIAYIWIPHNTMDLYRHHLQMKTFSSLNFSDLIEYVTINFEPVQYFAKYIISKTNDFNLLQFLVVFIGYCELFCLLGKYSIKKNISIKTFCIVAILLISSLRFLDFASGLWFYFSIINFSVGFYFEHVEKKNKIALLFYILSVLIHTGTVFLLLLLIFTKIIDRTKNNKKVKVIIVFLLFFLTGPVLTFLYRNVQNTFIKFLYDMYTSYFIRGDRFSSLHNGVTLALSLTNLLFSLFMVKISKFKYEKDSNFIYFLTFSIFALLFQASVFVRYSYLAIVLVIPYVINFFENCDYNKYLRFFVIFFISLLLSINIYRQYAQMKSLNLLEDIRNNYSASVFELRRNENEKS